jgi:hypothetical protein
MENKQFQQSFILKLQKYIKYIVITRDTLNLFLHTLCKYFYIIRLISIYF